ncbi:MAG: hypothetical protein R6V57_18675 [Vicinamibacterales bacterium]
MKFSTVGAWMTAGAAFWVSMGSLDVIADGEAVIRVAMLPDLARLAACLVLALAAGAIISMRLSEAPGASPGAAGGAPGRARHGDSFMPLYALSVLVLPYLPWLPDWLPVLRVFAGPGRWLVWLIVVSQVAWSVLGTGRGRRVVVRMRAWSALRSYVVIFAASAALFGMAALSLAPSGFFPGGDEPHYLVITQSLLADHDLRIENNHAQQDYSAYYNGELAPHAIAPGRDGGTYSVHPIGLPLLAAPAFALGGYRAVVVLMILLAAAAAALAWRWVRRVTGSVAAATFSWSVTALSVPFLANSGTVYPEIPAAFAVMAAATVGIRDVGLGEGAAGAAPARAWRALLLGLATAVLPWLHAKYALMAAVLLGIGVWRIWRDRPASPWTRERLVAMAAVPFACSVIAWLGFHYLIWGSPWPSAPYGGAAGTQMSVQSLVRGVPGLFIDQEYGIFAYAPALAMGFVGLWSMWRAGGRARGLAVEIGAALAALVGTVGAFQMWWGGTALPGRMLVSGLLLMTLPAAWEFREAADRPERRAAYRLLLLIGLAISLATILVRHGATLALGRNGISRFLEWLSPDWHLWAFAPDFIMEPAWFALAQAGIWLLAIAASAWAVGLLAARRTPARGSSRTGRGLAFLRADAGAVLAVALVTIVMPPVIGASLKPGPSPEDRSRIEMLESFDPHARPIGIRYDPVSLVEAVSMPQAFAVSARPGSRTARQPTPVLLNARFALPSGRYAFELGPRTGVEPQTGLSGNLQLQAGRSGGALAEWQVDAPAGSLWHGTFDLPVDVNFVGFRASAGLESDVGSLRVRPVRVVPNLDRVAAYEVLSSLALDRFVFLFHDGASYPETDGFWVRGSSRAIVSVVSRTGRLTTRVRLRLRSPVANSVRFEAPGLTWTTELEAGVPTEIDVEPTPLDGTLRMTISPAGGFRPDELTPGNRDRRFLGCWVEVVG